MDYNDLKLLFEEIFKFQNLFVRDNRQCCGMQCTNKVMEQNNFGRYLKNARINAGYTQAQIAKLLEYSSSQFISNVERGISSPPFKLLKVFADVYKLDREALLEEYIKHKREEWRKLMN